MYRIASGRISSGVPIATRSISEVRRPMAVIAMAPAMERANAVCMDLEIFSSSLAPKCWDITTVAPAERPVKKPISRLITVPVPPPTAARACLPRNWPTTTASTVL